LLTNQMLWASLSLIVGLLQAWDAGALGSTASVRAMTLTGVILPALAILLTRVQAARIVALLAGVALLTWARIVSPVSLNTLHIALLPAALYVLVAGKWVEMARKLNRAPRT
jgi:hypothetical protein